MDLEEVKKIDFHIDDVNDAFSRPPIKKVRQVLLVIFVLVSGMMLIMSFIQVAQTGVASMVIKYQPMLGNGSFTKIGARKNRWIALIRFKEQIWYSLGKEKKFQLYLTAYPTEKFGFFECNVDNAAAVFDPVNSSFTIPVVLNPTLKTSTGATVQLAEGMTGTVSFEKPKQSFFATIFHFAGR